jgi:histone H3/H4
MAIDDMYDDDSMHEHPPRQSMLPDLPDDVDGGTVQSLEFGRRAISEDPRFMYPGRISERFADLSELGPVEEEYEVDGTFINRRDGILDQTIDEALDEDDTTTQMRALTGRRDGRPSDVDLGVFGDEDDDTEEPTFRFMIPERIRAPLREEPQIERGDEYSEDALPILAEDDEDLDIQEEEEEEDEQDEITAALDGADRTGPIGIQGWESDNELDNDADLALYREEESAIDRSLQTQSPERPAAAKERSARKAKEVRISRRGQEYPSFPAAPVKKLALGFMKSQGSKAQLNKDTLTALVKVTDDFFEQIGIDLAAYAQHGGRKMIEESDVIALMKRYCYISISMHVCTHANIHLTQNAQDDKYQYTVFAGAKNAAERAAPAAANGTSAKASRPEAKEARYCTRRRRGLKCWTIKNAVNHHSTLWRTLR